MDPTELFLGRTHFLSKGKRAKRPRLLASTTADKEEVEDMAHCLMLLSRGGQSLTDDHDHQDYQTADQGSNNNLYLCKTCDRVFSSFQALGGHRASHKKPGKAEDKSKQNPNSSLSPSPRLGHGLRVGIKPNKVHECSLCGSVFGSGQALGGHMRRHRAENADVAGTVESSDKKSRHNVELDLNFPPAPEDSDDQDESLYEFGSREPPSLALSATPLVDCRY